MNHYYMEQRTHTFIAKNRRPRVYTQLVGHGQLASLMLWVLLAQKIPAIEARSAFVVCSTPLPISGHGGATAPGGGTVHLTRDGTMLECGSSVTAGETLTLTTQGTSGM